MSFVGQIGLEGLHCRVEKTLFKCGSLINGMFCAAHWRFLKCCLTKICAFNLFFFNIPFMRDPHLKNVSFNSSVQPFQTNLSHKRLFT